MDAFPGDGGAVIRCAEMILDVTGAVLSARHHAAKLAEDLAHRLSHHVCQHVEPACSPAAQKGLVTSHPEKAAGCDTSLTGHEPECSDINLSMMLFHSFKKG